MTKRTNPIWPETVTIKRTLFRDVLMILDVKQANLTIGKEIFVPLTIKRICAKCTPINTR